MISDGWNKNRENLIKELNNSSIEDFLEFPTVNATMRRGLSNDVLIELDQVVEEFGHDIEYASSGSRIQQYHALMHGIKCGINKDKIELIIEFGSGLGEMIYAAKEVFPNLKRHIILDIDVVCNFQKYILDKDNINHVDTVSDIDEFKALVLDGLEETNIESVLFLSICAISESPINLRDDIFSLIGDITSSNYILRVQEVWDGINNIDYFNSIFRDCYISECVFPTHFYIVGSYSNASIS